MKSGASILTTCEHSMQTVTSDSSDWVSWSHHLLATYLYSSSLDRIDGCKYSE
jgi:hypothetical protein